jgi:Na+/proline symporter
MNTSSPRQQRTTRAVAMFSALVVAACVGWAWLVQEVRPDACQIQPPPPNAQYLHC